MFVSSPQPLRLPQPTPAPRLKKSKFAEAVHDIWHSVFNWTLLMLIITPRPDVRRINKLRQRPSAANSKPGLLSHLSRLFSTTRRVFLSMVKGHPLRYDLYLLSGPRLSLPSFRAMSHIQPESILPVNHPPPPL
ncbi:hypothetical protein RSOL_260850 [Rhizoctonia solani AG-3 Rhs1AP]|uniref:Uncharacterized protein n=1 Tax=Rhizoctonia solani AG-3 Rhs1AP TaxID=1086054 RepID=A0A0A1UIA5_9AGAM|nr:hypothetical protein RSOL_260850 [Rhizoctonia solani AG-3 Rhs1AP]